MALIKTGIKEEKLSAGDFIHASKSNDDFVVCKRPDKLKLLLEKIKTENNIHFISSGDWSMHDLLTELLNDHGPAELYFTTYSIREFAVRQILNAIEAGKITAVTLLLDYKARARTPDVFILAEMNFNKIYLTSVHAKVTVLKTAIGYITIVGSANWTTNPRIEAGIISKDEAAGKFHIDWINKTLENAQLFG